MNDDLQEFEIDMVVNREDLYIIAMSLGTRMSQLQTRLHKEYNVEDQRNYDLTVEMMQRVNELSTELKEMDEMETQEGSVIASKKNCADCGNEFPIYQGELDFLRNKFGSDFVEPVRCKPCRKAKKERHQQNSDSEVNSNGKRTRTRQ